jgi:hypothetical protein
MKDNECSKIIIQAVSACVASDTQQHHPSKEVLQQGAKLIAECDEFAEEVAAAVFPNDITPDVSFYTHLQRLQPALGFSEEASAIAGHVWTRFMRRISRERQIDILRKLIATDNVCFFFALDALPLVITKIPLPSHFLLPWFLEVQSRIGNDLVQRGFWRSLESWSSHHPKEAFDGLRLLSQSELDDNKIATGAAILGQLRVAWEKGSSDPIGAEFEKKLQTHGDFNKRLIFHRSWINTGWSRGLSQEEFSSALQRMTAGTNEERSEAFNFLRCLIADKRTSQESIAEGIKWLAEHATPSLSDNSKHWIVHIVHSLASGSITDNPLLETLWPLMTSVQPIGPTSKQTWREIEYLLVDLLHKNTPQFERLLRALVDVNDRGVVEQMDSPTSFQYLCSELAMHAQKSFFADMFFSPISGHRRFAFSIYDKLPFDAFPDQMLVDRTDDEIALALFESQLKHLQPKQTFRFLIALSARAGTGSPKLVQLYRDELLYQAKNYPRGVLNELRTFSSSSELIRRVIAEADMYFENLRKSYNSPINSMEIPGLRRALTIGTRKRSRDVESKSEELSVLANLFSKSYLIYGTKGFRFCQNGHLGELSELKTMSVEMEMPRLLMIDPEGAAIRRHHAIRITKNLSDAITKAKQ